MAYVLLVNDYGGPVVVNINGQSWPVETGQRLSVTVPYNPQGYGYGVHRADNPECGDDNGGIDDFHPGRRYELRFYVGAGSCNGVPPPKLELPPRQV